MVVTGSDYVSFAPILCGWPHSGSCVSRSEGPLENDGAMGIFGLDDFFFFAFDRARCFFFSTTTLSNFFWICFLPFACAWRVCAGPLCGDLPSLDWTVQRKRLQSVDVDACIRMAYTSLQPLF